MGENERDSYTKQRFLWSDACNILKLCSKCSSRRNKHCEDKCYKSDILLQEKEKLLASSEDKAVASNDNVNLTKRLSLKMSFSSFSSPDIKDKAMRSQTSDDWTIKELGSYEHSALSIPGNLHKGEKDSCFSDTDLKFLVIPISSNKSDIIKHDEKIVLYKWNSDNINEYYDRKGIGSKLIELKLENTDSFTNNAQTYRMSTSKSNYSPDSFAPKNLASDSKYFSDSAANGLATFPNVYLKRLQRSSNSYASSTVSNVSSTGKISIEHPANGVLDTENYLKVLCAKSEENNSYMTSENTIAKDKLQETSKKRLDDCDIKSRDMKKKMKSSIDVQLSHLKENSQDLRDHIKEIRSSYRKSRSEDNFANRVMPLKARNDNRNNSFTPRYDCTLISGRLVCNNEGVCPPLDHDSETSETYDELGILFSQYMKLQVEPCKRTYCPLSRHLKQRTRHSIRKCQTRFNYHQVYPYDQRPGCNSGNVCTDTYDELKLMHTSASERKNVYQCMFERRKQFLNQPCALPNENFLTTRR
ncbi:uncharacterized protein LOC143371159 [Andrena cerasifolii]|uniref:uncharacterized protein LOC143371159 n=1 Tax=Andrena cerasifolii TaxID=2819439 RepID=UPI0040378C4B